MLWKLHAVIALSPVGKPGVEALEGRTLLSAYVSDNALYVVGTARSDEITISPYPDNGGGVQVAVVVNGTTTSFAADRFDSILVKAKGGDDQVLYSSTPMLPGPSEIDIAKNVFLYGGPGDDVLGAQPWASSPIFMSGGSGSDRLTSPWSNDTLLGGSGNDTLDSTRGDDLIDGGSGNDLVWAGMGDDSVYGGSGDDTIFGFDGRDMLYGDAGDDVIWGGPLPELAAAFDEGDTIDGGAGNDTLHGWKGADLLYGGAGNDVLYSEGDGDTLIGGAGKDTLIIDPL